MYDNAIGSMLVENDLCGKNTRLFYMYELKFIAIYLFSIILYIGSVEKAECRVTG